jgi:hypothetical protein
MLRLLVRFLSDILNRQENVIGFCDFWLLPNLLKDGLPNVCDSWLPVSVMVDTEDQQFA